MMQSQFKTESNISTSRWNKASYTFFCLYLKQSVVKEAYVLEISCLEKRRCLKS